MINGILNPNNYFFNPHSMPCFISGILITLESIFIFLQNRKSRLNSSFSLSAIFAGIWLTGVGLIYSSVNEPTAYFWSRWYSWLGIIFITPAVYMFSSAWEGSPSAKRAKFIYFNFICAFVFYIFSVSSDCLVKGVWHYPWGFYPKAGPAQMPFMICFYAIMILSFRNFIKSYKKEKIPMRKKQTRLVILAFVFGFVGSLDFYPNYGAQVYTRGGLFVLLFSTIVAYTIIRYKLMEIETVIHKTIAWFFTSAALIAPLAVLFYFTREWYSNLNPLAAWIYPAGVFLCFLLFVKTFHPKIDHFFQKGRHNLENVMSKFSEGLIHLRSLEELINKITDTIIDTIYANRVTILLYNDRLKKMVTVGSVKDSLKINLQIDPENPFLKWLSKNNRVLNLEFVEVDPRCDSIRDDAREYFKKLDAVICVPLALNETLIGLINLGRKTNLKPYNSFDLQFLTHLKNQSTIAISNSLVYDRVEELVRIRTDELVQTQKQLIQAEKLATVGTLAGGVAHEINNPLAAILTNAQMMLQSTENKDDKESLQLIEEAAKRCRSIVQKLMVYSRKPMSGREITKVDLRNVLDNVNSFLGYQLAQENIKVNVKSEDPPFVVEGNQNELEQVFTNLFLNSKDAIKKIKKSGEITVNISKNNKKICVKVKDDGCGIPKENLSKIFDPFFTTKDVGKGTGLGLSICQSIIEQHKGSITVDSQENNCAVFTITLPALKEA